MARRRRVPRAGLALCLAVMLAGAGPARGQWSNIKMGAETIEVFRDGYGVPHVYAKTLEGMFYGQGYVCATDRGWQLEMYRRDAKGTLAEVNGKQSLSHDREVRSMGYTEKERQQLFQGYDEESKRILRAYAAGVNVAMADAKTAGRLSPKFAEKEVEFAPWGVTDSVAVMDMMARRFGNGGDLELIIGAAMMEMQKRMPAERAREIMMDLFPLNDPSAPATIPVPYASLKASERARAGAAGQAGEAARARAVDRALRTVAGGSSEVLLAAAAQRRSALAEAARVGSFTGLGSNAWVVSPPRTATGNAMLFGGPMMGFGAPQIAYEVHLNGPGVNVIGMAFAGIPTVLIGHNDTAAWTTTSGGGDVTDIFAEELNPLLPTMYKWKGSWKAADSRTEVIRVRDGVDEQGKPKYDEVRHTVYRTVHGPVRALDAEHGKAYSVKSSWWLDKDANLAKIFFAFNRARTVEAFREACSWIPTTHNFFYADQKGDIGYWYVGRYPIRAEGWDPRWVQPGTGDHEWQGFMKFEDQPQAINPSWGYFGNWNNKPAVDWDSPYGPIFWGERIYTRLERNTRMTLKQCAAIAKETAYNDAFAEAFKRQFIAAAKHSSLKDDPRAEAAAKLAVKWDYVSGVDQVPAIELVYEAWFEELRQMVFADELGEKMASSKERVMEYLVTNLLLRLMETDPALKPRIDYLNGKNWREVAAAALKSALDKLTKAHGPDMSAWTRPGPTISFGSLGEIRSASGRGTYMQVVELSKRKIKGQNVLPPGQVEDEKSPHFKDQLEMYQKWAYKPMVYLRSDLK